VVSAHALCSAHAAAGGVALSKVQPSQRSSAAHAEQHAAALDALALANGAPNSCVCSLLAPRRSVEPSAALETVVFEYANVE
jgi:hypothetical protein